MYNNVTKYPKDTFKNHLRFVSFLKKALGTSSSSLPTRFASQMGLKKPYLGEQLRPL